MTGDDSKGDDRRRFLRTTSSVAMAGGIVGSYGTFAAVAGRYLYPADVGQTVRQFVAEVTRIAVGETMTYETPRGDTISLLRTGDAGTADDFIALSSVCPHLGCQVHWESQNNRFFCPCHNGTFAPTGEATGGPPAKASQSLPRYALAVDRGLLYIELPPSALEPRPRGA